MNQTRQGRGGRGRVFAALALLLGAGAGLLGPVMGTPVQKRGVVTTMKPHTAHAAVTWGTPAHDLRLGISVHDGTTIRLHLQNVGPSPLEVLSYVDAGEVHLDWYSLRLKDARGHLRTLTLSDAREQSAAISAHLTAGAALAHDVETPAWAARAVNGGQPLLPGTYEVTAVYEVSARPGHWSGKLEAGPIPLTVPGH